MNDIAATGGATQGADGSFMGGNDEAQKAADDAKVFEAIVDGAISMGASFVLTPMIMQMQQELKKQET